VREGLDKLMTELLPCGTAVADGAGRLAAANSAARVLLGLDGKDTDAVGLTRAGQPTSLAELLREHAAGPTVRRRVDVEHPENGRLRLTLTRVGEADFRLPIADCRLESEGHRRPDRAEPPSPEQSEIENRKSEIPGPWVHVVVERGPQRDWRWARNSDPLAVFAHELNNVLTSLREGLSLLRDEAAGPVTGQQRRLLEGVFEDAARITRLTGTMLAASGARAGRVRVAEGWVDARELAAGVVRSFEAPARRAGIGLGLGEVEAGLGCRGDSDLLTQALSNLVANAVKFTPAGGRVTVTVRRCAAQGEVLMEVAVRDTGQGLSQEDIERVLGCRPAEREPPRRDGRSGLGIGLSIVQEIAEEHGGRLVAEGEPGVGCCFRLLVPQDFRRREPWRLRQIAKGLRLARAVAVPLSIVEIRVACPGGAGWTSGAGLVHLPLIEQCLEESLRPSDTVMVCESSATLVLYDVDGRGARRAANRAVRALVRLLARFPQPYPQSVIGWGVASFPTDGATAPALAEAAQRDMELLPAGQPPGDEAALAAGAAAGTHSEGCCP
jgi:signal transduction histidine kinase